MTVAEGWNLVSFPFVPNAGVTINDAIPTAITPGYWFNTEERSYRIETVPMPGKGVWVYCADPDTFDVAGMLIDMVELNLHPGWNLVGMPWEMSGSIPLGAVTVTPDVRIAGNTYGWNPATGYVPTTAYTVGQGYWILAVGEGHLIAVGDTTTRKVIPAPEPEWVFAMSLAGMPFEIGLDNNATIGLDGYDRAIPPCNPDGGEIFGGKAGEYYLSRDVKPGDKAEFDVIGAGKMLDWDTRMIPNGMKMTLMNNGVSVGMSSINHAVLGSNAKIIVSRTLPEKAILYSAKPNPFNPVTEIKFALPEKTNAELAIFDILGHKVSTLVSGEMSGGEHAVSWRGTDDLGREVPSGMYFYRLTVAGGTSITKSMALVR
jgi:hypothetical protein